MITFVYCCICLLIVCCQTTRIESEENVYNNDSPDTLPKVVFLQYKVGSDFVVKCNNHNSNRENLTWEFKRCGINYKGILCDNKSMYKLDYSEGQWKKLDFNRKRKKLEIKNATEENIGLYRCLYNDSIIKIYRVDLVVAAKFIGPPPQIVSLMSSSNSTIAENTSVVIQCKAQSIIPPEIRWFKECHSFMKCEVHSRLPYNGHCYCGISTPTYAFPINSNNYVNKLIIHNSRNIDSGTYVCLVITVYGEDHQNVTIQVGGTNSDGSSEEANNSFSLLFLIPLFFILVPVTIWLGFYRRKKKTRRRFNEHQKQLIKPVVEL